MSINSVYSFMMLTQLFYSAICLCVWFLLLLLVFLRLLFVCGCVDGWMDVT